MVSPHLCRSRFGAEIGLVTSVEVQEAIAVAEGLTGDSPSCLPAILEIWKATGRNLEDRACDSSKGLCQRALTARRGIWDERRLVIVNELNECKVYIDD